MEDNGELQTSMNTDDITKLVEEGGLENVISSEDELSEQQ